MIIKANNADKTYLDCIIYCNGKRYKEVYQINYIKNSIIIFARDKKGELVITSDNIKKVKVYGKIKVFFKGELK